MSPQAGVVGAAVGAVAAGVAIGAATQRRLLGRARAHRGVRRLGSLRGRALRVRADDGVELYAEIDDPAENGANGTEPPLTVVFAHGYGLNLDSWHFERRDLRGHARLVFFDQRSHGRSGRSPDAACTLDQLARDLAVVIERCVPDAPVVLVGHSMGGMAIMRLADQRPEWFGDRVVGVGLLSTSNGLMDTGVVFPGMPGRVLKRMAAPVLATLNRAPALVERGRRVSGDLAFALTRYYSFGSGAPDEYVEFVNEMIAATPLSTITAFWPIFTSPDRLASLTPLQRVPCVVVAGDHDLLTPGEHAQQIVRAVPGAELVEVLDCGHLGLIEHHDEFTDALVHLLDESAGYVGATVETQSAEAAR